LLFLPPALGSDSDSWRGVLSQNPILKSSSGLQKRPQRNGLEYLIINQFAANYSLPEMEGKNIVIEFRWADGVDQPTKFAAE
jgi:hypothetical protein